MDTANNSKIKRTANVVPENPRGPISFAARTPFTITKGVLHPLLAVCAVLICDGASIPRGDMVVPPVVVVAGTFLTQSTMGWKSLSAGSTPGAHSTR